MVPIPDEIVVFQLNSDFKHAKIDAIDRSRWPAAKRWQRVRHVNPNFPNLSPNR
jgi:hypothetical protein